MGDGWQHKDDYPDWSVEEDRKISYMERHYVNPRRVKADRREVAPPAHINLNSTVAEATPTRSKYAMNTNETITLIQLSQGARIIAASYDLENASGGQYHFKDVLGLGLRKDDIVVVQTGNSFKLVRVTSGDVLPTDCGCALDKLKHVVSKIDTDAIDAVLATERQAVHRLAMSEVTERLSVYRKQLGAEGFADVERLLAPAKDEVPNWAPSRPRNEDDVIDDDDSAR